MSLKLICASGLASILAPSLAASWATGMVHAACYMLHTRLASVIHELAMSRKLAFDIFGKDVELANEMEANGVAAQINLSDAAYQRFKQSDRPYEFSNFRKDLQ